MKKLLITIAALFFITTAYATTWFQFRDVWVNGGEITLDSNVTYSGVAGNPTYSWDGITAIINFNGKTLNLAGTILGDAIFGGKETYYLDNARITNNNTPYYGSPGYFHVLAINGKITFTGETFFFNNHGGALDLACSAIVNFYGNASFTGNMITSGSGGAVYLRSGTINFSGSKNIFENNSAYGDGLGGAIYMRGTANIWNAAFKNNTAQYNGGAIYMDGGTLNIYQTDTVTNGIFEGNKAAGASNAIYLTKTAAANFSIGKDATVEMRDNIAGNSTTTVVRKLGQGTFELYGNMSQYSGILTISNGLFDVKNAMNFNLAALNLTKTGSDMPVLSLWNGQQNLITTGTLTADAGSRLLMRITPSTATSDKITVTNAALLNGVLTVRLGVGFYSAGTLYNLITAGTTLNGALIDGIKNNNNTLAYVINPGDVGFQWVFDQATQSLILKVVSGGNDGADIEDPGGWEVESGLSTIAGLSYNGKQVAGALDKVAVAVSGTDLGDIIDHIRLVLTTDEERAAALTEMSGYFLANALGNDLYSSSRKDILSHLRNNCPGCSSGGLWGQVTGYSAKINGDSNSIGDYKESFYGGVAGYDWYDIDKDTIFGGYLKYMKGSATQSGISIPSSPKSNNETDSNAFSLGVYGGMDRETWDLSAVFSAGFNQYSTKRDIPTISRTAKADFNGIAASLDIESGYKMSAADNLMFRPYGGGEINTLYHSGFTETGAIGANLSVDSGFLAVTALKAGADLIYDTGALNLFGGAELKYVLTGRTPEITASLEGTNASFTSRGAERDALLLGLRAGAEGKVTDQLSLFGTINTLISGNYNDLGWKVGLRYAFCESKPKAAKPAPVKAQKMQLPQEFEPVQQPKPVKQPVVVQQPQPVTKMPSVTIPAAPPSVAAAPVPVLEIGSMYYNDGISDLGPNARKHIEQNAKVLKKTKYTKVYITGHTDNKEAKPAALSAERAKKAADYLIAQGIPAAKIEYSGKGASKPAQSNATEQGRKVNRRVDFLVK